jgi:hypothetical protein
MFLEEEVKTGYLFGAILPLARQKPDEFVRNGDAQCVRKMQPQAPDSRLRDLDSLKDHVNALVQP